jgi:hypothetical protein
MPSTAAVVSLASVLQFTLFTSLLPEIRFIIRQLSLLPRVIETLKRNQRGKKVESDLCASLVFILDRRDATSEKLRPLHVPR